VIFAVQWADVQTTPKTRNCTPKLVRPKHPLQRLVARLQKNGIKTAKRLELFWDGLWYYIVEKNGD